MPPHQTKPFAESDPSFPESHHIDTPEQMQVAFAIAGIGSRFLALAMDTVLQGAAAALLLVVFAISGLLSPVRFASVWMLAFLITGAFLLFYGYFVLFELFWNGQTPGKRMIGIRVIKESGRPLLAVETIGRNLMRIVDQLPGFYAVGLAVALFNSQNKRLGDFVAGSVVIREESLRALRSAWHRDDAQELQPQIRTNSLTAEDVVLIDAFLQRRRELDADVRYRIAREILQRLEGKLEIDAGDRPSAEKILEAAVYDWRSSGRLR